MVVQSMIREPTHEYKTKLPSEQYGGQFSKIEPVI